MAIGYLRWSLNMTVGCLTRALRGVCNTQPRMTPPCTTVEQSSTFYYGVTWTRFHSCPGSTRHYAGTGYDRKSSKILQNPQNSVFMTRTQSFGVFRIRAPVLLQHSQHPDHFPIGKEKGGVRHKRHGYRRAPPVLVPLPQ